MSDRGIQRLLVTCVLVGLLMAIIAFARTMLSPMVATFIAGLGIGAAGAVTLLRIRLKERS